MASKDLLKQKLWMKKNQADAKKIMMESSKIWQTHKWEHRGMVKQDVLKKEIMKKFGKKKFDPVVAEILEDANFHSVNQALDEMGLVEYKGDRLTKYKKLGGRTWDIE